MSNNSDNETLFVSRKVEQKKKPLPYIKARILWPALGFPEVVAPKNKLSVANGTNAIEMLLFSKKVNLNSQDVAKHLRYVTWKERHCRYLNPDITKCSFSSSEMEVKRVYPKRKNDLVEEVHFCSGHVVAGLSKFVIEFYDKVGIKYLYQVRIYESASAKLNPGLYNLFWINNNKNAKPENVSTEMEILKKHFAEGRKPDGTWWRGTYPKPFIREYEYDYGKPPAANSRTEVFHPLFVWGAESPESLKIGHLTDSHVCLRSDTFEINLQTAKVPVEQYNNYNTRFMEFYFQAKQACDVLLLTGDIIDYGRGHKGRKASLNDDNSYQLDRNWFLLYSLIASGDDKYQKPMYTVLGNHDWRLHPYGPVSSFYSIAPDMNLSKEETERVHGPGADSAWYSPYVSEIPILTDLDSVKWYFLLINPFLDYAPRLPGRYTLLMLDWAEDEQILGANVQRTGLPIAEESLTDIQKNMVKWFADRDDPAKVLGMHASIVGPRPEWDNESLDLGLLRPCPFCKGSGQRRVRDRFDNRYISVGCKCKQFRGQTRIGDRWLPSEHPLLAVNTPPEKDTDTSEEGLNSMPTYGSIKLHRDWLIETLKEKRISLVCCGHAHRNSIFVVVNPGSYNVFGQRQVIHGLGDKVDVAFFKSGKREDGGGYIPKGTAVRIADRGILPIPAPELRPIFVNTIAAGPVSDDCPEKDNPIKTPPGYAEITLNSDGTVQSIEYKNSNLKLLQWECWLRKPSKAKSVKLHDGGIIAGYGSDPEAMRESEKNRSTWPKGGDYECWIKRRSKAKAVKLDKKIGGIVGVYHNEGAARADKPVDEPWQKWPG